MIVIHGILCLHILIQSMEKHLIQFGWCFVVIMNLVVVLENWLFLWIDIYAYIFWWISSKILVVAAIYCSHGIIMYTRNRQYHLNIATERYSDPAVPVDNMHGYGTNIVIGYITQTHCMVHGVATIMLFWLVDLIMMNQMQQMIPLGGISYLPSSSVSMTGYRNHGVLKHIYVGGASWSINLKFFQLDYWLYLGLSRRFYLFPVIHVITLSSGIKWQYLALILHKTHLYQILDLFFLHMTLL